MVKSRAAQGPEAWVMKLGHDHEVNLTPPPQAAAGLFSLKLPRNAFLLQIHVRFFFFF